MNKNISFFIALTIFNFTFASEEVTTQEEQAQEAQVLVAKDSNFATRSQIFKVTIQAKDATDTSLFDQKAQQLFDMIQSAHRDQNSSNLYNQILTFVKELQEAILAGLNLFITATTSKDITISQPKKEIAATEQSFDQTESVESFTHTETETVSEKNIELSINISLEKAEDEELFNAISAKMNTLAQMLNENSHAAEEITSLLNDIILAAHHLPNTNLTVKIN